MPRTVRLDEIAYARSGDKGDDANVGIWAKSDAAFAVMRDVLTTDRVKEHFAAVCEGTVTGLLDTQIEVPEDFAG